jgi:hypothetical protein
MAQEYKLLRRILLTTSRALPVEREKFDKRVFRVDTPKRVFFFQAENEADMHAWVGAINAGLRLPPPPHVSPLLAHPGAPGGERSDDALASASSEVIVRTVSSGPMGKAKYASRALAAHSAVFLTHCVATRDTDGSDSETEGDAPTPVGRGTLTHYHWVSAHADCPS